jgi:hypothetical protein
MTIHLVVQVYKPSQVEETKELLINDYDLNCINTSLEKRLIIFKVSNNTLYYIDEIEKYPNVSSVTIDDYIFGISFY